jgi:prepilin-type N-terminal cleavage/methylation domain-containing protein
MNVAKYGHSSQSGFTLIETIIALAVLSIGILSLAVALGSGLLYMNNSEYSFIAEQKAAEAVESVYTARDIQQASWTNINNTSSGGIFLAGPQPLCGAGADGIVGTADDDCNPADGANGPDYILMPGPDGLLHTADDVMIPLSNFTRTITIADVPGRSGLRSITVVITYKSDNYTRSYTLSTNISEFS